MTNTIVIRKKVAELCGFTDIAETGKRLYQKLTFISVETTEISGFKGGNLFRSPIPSYELSLDAIIEAFDEHGFSYTLSKRINEDEKLLGYFAVAGDCDAFSDDCDAFSDTAPKAMCYLFIKLMESQ